MFFSIKMGLDSGAQAEMIATLAREKIPYIQTSSGLCVKATREQLSKALPAAKAEAIDTKGELPPDVKAFIES